MKTTTTTILLFLTITGFSQNWADSLAKFERKDSKKSYGWFDSLSVTKQTDHLREWYSLKIKSSIESRLTNISDSTANVITQANQRQAYIQHLIQVHGFACNNSKADWRLAYNHPEWFGTNWQSKADQAWATSTLNDFLNFCKQYNY